MPRPLTPLEAAAAAISERAAHRGLSPAALGAAMVAHCPEATAGEATRFARLVCARQADMLSATTYLWRAAFDALDIQPEDSLWLRRVAQMPRPQRQKDPMYEAAAAAAKAAQEIMSERESSIPRLARTACVDPRDLRKLLTRPIIISKMWHVVALALGHTTADLAIRGGAPVKLARDWAEWLPVSECRNTAEVQPRPPQPDAPAPSSPPPPPAAPKASLEDQEALALGRAILSALRARSGKADAARDAAIAEALERSARAEASAQRAEAALARVMKALQ